MTRSAKILAGRCCLRPVGMGQQRWALQPGRTVASVEGLEGEATHEVGSDSGWLVFGACMYIKARMMQVELIRLSPPGNKAGRAWDI